MAGSYPDAPGMKFAYDADGSAGSYEITSGAGSGTFRSLTAGEMTTLNSEAGTAVSLPTANGDNTTARVAIVFPQLRDITGINSGIFFGGNSTGQSRVLETSADTTNGRDGAWTTRTTPTLSTNFRSGVQTYSLTGVKAVRWTMTMGQSFPSANWAQCHIYGSIPVATTPDRLTLWHPTLDQELGGAALDFGDVQRGSVSNKTFRVKNLSATLTANSIVVSVSALTEGSPAVAGQYTFGIAGSFAGTQTIASLAPGVISAVVTARLTMVAGAALSLYRQRISAVAATWS